MLLTGCASAPKGAVVVDGVDDLPSIQAKYSDQLSMLTIGMPHEEFQAIFPKAYVGGKSHKTTAYEIVSMDS